MSEEAYPSELDALAAPSNTPQARVDACGVPYPWSWETSPLLAPDAAFAANRRTAELVRAWSEGDPRVWGVLLHGGAGNGKTGVACSVVRAAAVAAVGPRGYWIYATGDRARAAVAAGEFRPRPAPAHFARWRDLKSLLDRAKTDRLPWDESPPLTAEKILSEIEGRCWVLALDDVDVDALTPWKEEVLLRLLELPARRRRLVVTMNVDPASAEGIARFGERVVDRLMDPSLFARFKLGGDSLRRRKVA